MTKAPSFELRQDPPANVRAEGGHVIVRLKTTSMPDLAKKDFELVLTKKFAKSLGWELLRAAQQLPQVG
jgi:hypothetical protein